MKKEPKKLHSSGTRQDAEKQRAKRTENLYDKRKTSHLRPMNTNTRRFIDGVARTSAERDAVPAKSSIKKADKQGRYKK